MTTAFGFSAGDFVAGINLVQTLISALNDSRGSSKEYLELIAELRSLETALLEVKALDLEVEQRAQRAALRQAATQCQTSIDNFLNDLSKYHPHLRLGGSLSGWKDKLRKIQWRFCKKEDLLRFRAEIGFHAQSIQMLMLTIQIHSTSLQGNFLKHQLAELDHHGATLQDIQASLDKVHSSFDNLREDIARHGSIQRNEIAKIERMGQAIIITNFQSFKMLEKIYNALPLQIQKQQPVIFRDALNRVAPIHLEWVNSREAFFAALEARFKDLGSHKVRRREFALQRAGSSKDIDLSRPWDTCFCPGQRIDMSMIFKELGSTNTTVCPACQHECVGETDREVECTKCATTFRRVLDVTENSVSQNGDATVRTSTPPRMASFYSRTRPKLGVQEKLEDIQDFRRVRVHYSLPAVRQDHSCASESDAHIGLNLWMREDVAGEPIDSVSTSATVRNARKPQSLRTCKRKASLAEFGPQSAKSRRKTATCLRCFINKEKCKMDEESERSGSCEQCRGGMAKWAIPCTPITEEQRRAGGIAHYIPSKYRERSKRNGFNTYHYLPEELPPMDWETSNADRNIVSHATESLFGMPRSLTNELGLTGSCVSATTAMFPPPVSELGTGISYLVRSGF